MSRQGKCWDNAVAERCCPTLKTERMYREDLHTREQAQTAVCEDIAVFYHRQRCHSAHDDLAPRAHAQALNTNGI